MYKKTIDHRPKSLMSKVYGLMSSDVLSLKSIKDFALILGGCVLLGFSIPLVLPFVEKENLVFSKISWIFAWVGLVPLLFAVHGDRPPTAFKKGMLGGIVFYSIALYWLNIAMIVFGHLGVDISAIVLAFLIGFLSVFWGVCFWVWRFFANKKGYPSIVVFPAIWTSAELLRNYLFSGFPWANLAYSQYNLLPMIQSADIFGVYGLCFLIVLVNCVLFRVVLFIKRETGFPAMAIVGAFLLVSVNLLYGKWKIKSVENSQRQAPRLRVAVLQGNIEQGIKNKSHLHVKEIITRYNTLVKDVAQKNVDLIVWPEAAYPGWVWKGTKNFGRLRAKVAEVKKSYQLIGASTWFREKKQTFQTNSAFLINPDQKVIGRYDKSHLVPFGEYVPLSELIPVTRFVSGIGSYVPGESLDPLCMGDYSFGVLICYEGIFPEISREIVGGGAQFLVNITNDAWYGYSSAPHQHLYMYVFRAVENRRWVVRAANTGISAFIDSAGRVWGQTQLFETTMSLGDVRVFSSKTIYNITGDVFAYLCVAYMGGMAIIKRRKKV